MKRIKISDLGKGNALTCLNEVYEDSNDKEKIIDLENGCELVVEGDYKKLFAYNDWVLHEQTGVYGPVRIYVRRKK